MKGLVLKGKTEIDGMKFHDIEGGFGSDSKAMLAKDIASIHRKEVREINQAINMNIKRFKKGVDIIELKGTKFEINLIDNGIYNQNSLNRSKNIYLLSERGYSKLLKILEDDYAWEQYEKLVDGYFNMRKTVKNKRKLEKLGSVNNAVRTIFPILEKAGMKPHHQAYLLKQLYGKAGIEIPVGRQEEKQKIYDLSSIAATLGVLSANNNPHGQAVGAIVSKLDIPESEIVLTSYERNGHVGTSHQYKESVIQKVDRWISDNDHPKEIAFTDSKGNSKKYKVNYREVN